MPLLLEGLEDEAWVVRSQAAVALGRIGDGRAVRPLEQALTDAAWWVRANAAEALRACGEPGRDALRRALVVGRPVCPRSGARGARARGSARDVSLRAPAPGGRMTALESALLAVNVLTIAYFAALNLIYTVLMLLGLRTVTTYVRRRPLMDIETISQSELTTPISIVIPAYDEGPVIVDSVQGHARLRLPAARGAGRQRRLGR